MTETTKQRLVLLTKVGLVGTAVMIPFGLWAMDRWSGPDTWKTAALLTAVGFGVKEYMMHGGEAEGTGHA